MKNNNPMKYITAILLLLVMEPVMAQDDDVVTRFISQYEGRDDFTTVYITSKMFSLIAQIPEGEDEQDFMNIVRRLNGIRVLSSDSLQDAAGLYRKAIGTVEKDGYEDLMVVKDGSEETKFLVREKGDVISDLVMISGASHRFTLISLTGNLRLKDISKISKTMDIRGFDKLDKVDDKQ